RAVLRRKQVRCSYHPQCVRPSRRSRLDASLWINRANALPIASARALRARAYRTASCSGWTLMFPAVVGFMVISLRLTCGWCILVRTASNGKNSRIVCKMGMDETSARSQPRLPSLDLLKGFEAAARLLSFTKAGAELYLSQSAVSRQIQELEEQLGVRLFQRRHRSLTL